MALDGIVLRKITDELQAILPCRITKINNISDTELLFQLKGNNRRDALLLSCHSQFNRIHLTDKKYPVPDEPSNFVMLLRKHLENGQLTTITQGGLDRYLTFTVLTHNDIGDPVTRYLLVELMGKYANAILTDEQFRILDALKRIPPYENSKRTLLPGALYDYPDQQGKQDPFFATSYDTQRSFTAQFSGFSPLLSREFEYRIHNGENFSAIMDEIRHSKSLFVSENQHQVQYHVIPLTQFDAQTRAFSIMEGLDELYFYKEEKDRIRQQTGDLFKFTRHELKKNQQKLGKLQDSLTEALDCDKWHLYGDLLYAYQDRVARGMTEVALPSFEDGTAVLVPLDPKLDVKQNAKKCFQRYNKGKKGQSHIHEQIALCSDEIEYFTVLAAQLEHIDFKDAEEIKEELSQYGYMASKAARKRKRKESRLNFLEIVYNESTRIFVGKNNRQNEFLTFKLAHRNDYWFHAQGYHGSHTIVQTDDLSEDIVTLASMLAAYFSEGRQSSSIPVDYTQVRHLKKIPKSKTGLVSMGTHKTRYVDIDKAKLRKYIVLKEIL